MTKQQYKVWMLHMFSRSESNPLRTIHHDADRARSFSDPVIPHLSEVIDNDVTATQQLFRIPTGPDKRLVAINDPGSFGAELLRTLAVRLRQIRKRHGIKKLLITSTVPGEGKTIVSANLAITLSMHRSRVLLVDGDLRRASISRWFHIADNSLAANWRENGSHRLPALRKAEGLPLWVIPAGEPVENAGDILQSSEFSEGLAAIEAEFDWIVFDSTPLVPFGDASILASLADAVVLVTRKGITPKKELGECLKLFDASKIVATILNCANVTTHKYYLDYYAQGSRMLPSTSVGSEPAISSILRRNILRGTHPTD
jgi:capsular exopolysaccharide synthesis family protein